MPNIEIHGYMSPNMLEVQVIKQRIYALLVHESFAGEVVVGQVLDYFVDFMGLPKPFLRIWDTDRVRGQRIQNILRMNGFEVELPEKLVRFVEPPMWSEEEILVDLRLMISSTRLSGQISIEPLRRAIASMVNRDYAEVANFYCHVASILLTSLHNRLLTVDELSQKVDSRSLELGVDEVKERVRLVMIVQIIDSLAPELKKKKCYTAK